MPPQRKGSFGLAMRKMTVDSFAGGENNLLPGRYFALITSVCAVIVLACAISFNGQSMEYYSALAEYGAAGQIDVYGQVIFYYWLIVVGSAWVFVASGVGFWASHTQNKTFVYFYFLNTIIGCICVTAAVVQLGFVFEAMGLTICDEAECNPRDGFGPERGGGAFTDLQSGVVNLNLAVFDECCVNSFDSYDLEVQNAVGQLPNYRPEAYYLKKNEAQGVEYSRIQNESFGVCPQAGTPVIDVCNGKNPSILEEVFSGIIDTTLLCTCANNEQKYNQVKTALTTSKNQGGAGCAALEKATWVMDKSLNIPTTNIYLLEVLQSDDAYGSFFADNQDLKDAINIPLIGNPAPPLNKEYWPEGGFGCGLGIAKGFLWFSFLYAEQSFDTVILAAILCTGSQLVTVTLFFIYLRWYSNSGDLEELVDYDEAVGIAHINRPPRATQVSVTVSAPALDRSQVEAQITAFYKAYEPAKLVDGKCNKEIVDYAMDYGLDAVNQKLQSKYNADLNTIADKRKSYVAENMITSKITTEQLPESLI